MPLRSGYFMVTLRNFILAILMLSLLTECNTKQSNNTATDVPIQPPPTQTQNRLTGEWKYDNTIWYTSELTLQANGTFKFHNQGCYGQNFTEGHWTNINGAVLLSSYDTYKPVEEATTVTQPLIEKPAKKRNRKKVGVEFTFIGFKVVTTSKLPGPNDTMRIYFDKVHLNLKGDTLYCADNNKFITEHKFSRTKNNH